MITYIYFKKSLPVILDLCWIKFAGIKIELFVLKLLLGSGKVTLLMLTESTNSATITRQKQTSI